MQPADLFDIQVRQLRIPGKLGRLLQLFEIMLQILMRFRLHQQLNLVLPSPRSVLRKLERSSASVPGHIQRDRALLIACNRRIDLQWQVFTSISVIVKSPDVERRVAGIAQSGCPRVIENWILIQASRIAGAAMAGRSLLIQGRVVFKAWILWPARVERRDPVGPALLHPLLWIRTASLLGSRIVATIAITATTVMFLHLGQDDLRRTGSRRSAARPRIQRKIAIVSLLQLQWSSRGKLWRLILRDL